LKIELAKSLGFCFGVKRAIKIAEDAKDAHTFGPLIHNSLENERLKRDFNVGLIENIDELQDNSRVIIRTHGIEKKNLVRLHEKNMEVIDATCPYVTKPQQIVEEMSEKGYEIVIFGDKNHPEIKGVMSYAQGDVKVVLEPQELDSVTLKDRVAIIAQTTRREEDFEKVVTYLMRRVREVRVFNTICNATFENQDAARELSQKADVMIVIGGKNSSNTKQLFQICEQNCDHSYLIESEAELDPAWFDNKKFCGISAGASTPDWVISDVIQRIEAF
jgi:4-hydroxy-3-methylbut-2-en-1-yl diphosphate reductase